MPESDIILKVSADTTQVQSQMRDIRKTIGSVGNEAKETGQKIDKSLKPTSNANLLKRNYGDLNLIITELNEKLRNEIALKNRNASATAKRITSLQKERDAIERQANAMTKTRSVGQQLNSTFSKLGITIGIAFAARAIINFTQESIKAYNVQAQAEQRLLVALKGRKDVQQQLLNQATARQKLTLFGDEETIAAQSALAALVKEGDSIEQLIPLIQDFATAKGVDLVTAADLVGKAVGSSTNALSRYGITITGAVGSSERLDTAVKSLTEAFGGQAEAAAKAGVGPLQQLSNAWGDLKEQIGGLIAESISGLAKSFTELVTVSTEYIQASPVDQIKQEREEFLVLAQAAADDSLTKERRLELLGKLQKIQPDFLKGLDTEKLTFEQVDKAVKDVLKSYDDRVDLMIAQISVQERLNSLNEIALEVDQLRNNAAALQAGTYESQRRQLELTSKFANVATGIVEVMPEWSFWAAKTVGVDIQENLIRYNKNMAKTGELQLEIVKNFEAMNTAIKEFVAAGDTQSEQIKNWEADFLKLGGTQEELNNIRAFYLQQSEELTGGSEGKGGGAIGKEISKYEQLTKAIDALNKKMIEQIIVNDKDINTTRDQIIEKTEYKNRIDAINDSLQEFIDLATGPLQKLEEKTVIEIPITTKVDKLDKIDTPFTDAAKAAGEETGLSFIDGFNVAIAEISTNKDLQNALKGLVEQLGESLEEILLANINTEIEMIDNYVSNLDKAISEQDTKLQEQKRLNEEGAASNVRIEEERLNELKAARDKALQDRQKQARKERDIQRTLAVVKGVVAATEAIAQNAGTGPGGWVVGLIAAATVIAEIATLFATADNSIKFEQGTAQILGGKRHSQGGVNLGDVGEAEGGEFLGILSRSKTQKYGKAMTTLFDGINENNAVKAQMGLLQLASAQPVERANWDGQMELKEIPEIKGIYNEIRKQNKTVTHEGKYRVEKFGNTTRKIYVN